MNFLFLSQLPTSHVITSTSQLALVIYFLPSNTQNPLEFKPFWIVVAPNWCMPCHRPTNHCTYSISTHQKQSFGVLRCKNRASMPKPIRHRPLPSTSNVAPWATATFRSLLLATKSRASLACACHSQATCHARNTSEATEEIVSSWILWSVLE